MTNYINNTPDIEHFKTFKNSEILSDDWYDSLLYYKIYTNSYNNKDYCHEIIKLKEYEIRKNDELTNGLNKGFEIIECILLDLLGTFEDLNTFKSIFSEVSINSFEGLCKKCENMMIVREKTEKILKIIIQREKILKSLKEYKGYVKNCITSLCKLNKILRNSIQDWLLIEGLPFDRFCFKGVSYLTKMEEDDLIIQQYLCE